MSLLGGHPALIRIALYYLCCQGITLDELIQEAIASYRVANYTVLTLKMLLNLAMRSLISNSSNFAIKQQNLITALIDLKLTFLAKRSQLNTTRLKNVQLEINQGV